VSEVRLNKYLADQGLASRRKADELIERGLVLINGKVATIGQKVNPESDEITVKDAVLAEQKQLIYLVLNKPADCVTSSQATKTEPKIVIDLVPERPRVFPVGRLDKATTGLLILTNDGVLAYRLTHPSFDCEKEYEATLDAPLTGERVRKIEAGVRLERTATKPTKIKVLAPQRARITLTEGRNRQVRKIFGKVGCEVTALKRVRIKKLKLDEKALPVGQWRYLTAAEVTMLRAE
jgi:pseudouridine synthase